MNIPPKYEDVVAQLGAERELHKIATETLGQFADENQKLHADLAALREELESYRKSYVTRLVYDALQQRLTVAEQRIGELEGLLREIRQSCELSKLRDAQIDAALKPAEEGEGS